MISGRAIMLILAKRGYLVHGVCAILSFISVFVYLLPQIFEARLEFEWTEFFVTDEKA